MYHTPSLCLVPLYFNSSMLFPKPCLRFLENMRHTLASGPLHLLVILFSYDLIDLSFTLLIRSDQSLSRVRLFETP